jgi:hypothetical protein
MHRKCLSERPLTVPEPQGILAFYLSADGERGAIDRLYLRP